MLCRPALGIHQRTAAHKAPKHTQSVKYDCRRVFVCVCVVLDLGLLLLLPLRVARVNDLHIV